MRRCQNVNDYIRALAQSDLTGASTAAQEMNDTFTRRQMMIGTSIDFAALKKDLQSQMDGLGTAEPIGSVTTAVSGVSPATRMGARAFLIMIR